MAEKYYSVDAAFDVIENNLLLSMSRNLKRHLEEEAKEGFSWEMWQAEQLRYLEAYRRRNALLYTPVFESVEEAIEEFIREAYAMGGAETEIAILEAVKQGFVPTPPPPGLALEFFKMNESKLDALVEATKTEFRAAETAILRKSEDVYRKIIFNSHAALQTGSSTLTQAVETAAHDYFAQGLTSVQYKNGAQVSLEAYSQMALRTAHTRAYVAGAAAKRDEYGIDTVIVNRRGVACPKCIEFCGKVFIDDVYSAKPAPPAGQRSYPLLSEAVAAGLYHPNCKDSHTTYFPGVSTPPREMTAAEKSEAARVYNLEQRQRYNERTIRKYKRLKETALTDEKKKKYSAKLKEWQKHQKKFVDENGDCLRRRYENERLPLVKIETPLTDGS